jgi:hypothetical protein
MKKMLVGLVMVLLVAFPAVGEDFVDAGTGFMIHPDASYNPNLGVGYTHVFDGGLTVGVSAGFGSDSEDYLNSGPFAQQGWSGTETWSGTLSTNVIAASGGLGYYIRIHNGGVLLYTGFGLARAKVTDKGVYSVSARHWFYGSDSYSESYSDTVSLTQPVISWTVSGIVPLGARMFIWPGIGAGYHFDTDVLSSEFTVSAGVSLGIRF